MSAVPRLVGNDYVSRTILPARRRPKLYPDLVPRLEPVIAEWIKSAADWPDLGLGRSRVLTFETPLPGGATFFVRFWSEPRTALLCEVPSGIQDEALRAALVATAVPWAEQNKMTVSGKARNFRSLFPIDSAFDIEVAAAFVVETLDEFIRYAGQTPLIATLASADRSGWGNTLDSFTEEEVARVFQTFGFQVTPSPSEPNDGIDEPQFTCRKSGIETVVTMMDPVPGSRLHKRVRFDMDLPATDRELQRSRERGRTVTADMNMVAVSGIHAFTGGVTPEWLVERVRDWDNALKEHRRDMRREGKQKRSATPPGPPPETIH